LTFLINVNSNVREIEKSLKAYAFKQIPFAQAQAVTALARRIVPAEQENERKKLDRPKPFTQNAMGVVGAKKGSPTAIVYMKDITAHYLEPYQFGGRNVLNSKALLKPIGAVKDLDEFGNLPRSFLRKLKGRSDIFIGPVKTKSGIVNGVWQRAEGEHGTKPATQTRVSKTGRVIVRKVAAYVPSRSDRRLRLLVEFTDAHPIRQRLDWFGVAEKVVAKHFNEEMGRALAKAIASAR
jgi:hypothetical protein